MKIRRIKVDEVTGRPLLDKLELSFSDDNDPESIDPNCIIGVNGSGKSQLLEIIAEIFHFLDSCYRKINIIKLPEAPCIFELQYSIKIKNLYYEVQICLDNKKNKIPDFVVLNSNYEEILLDPNEFESFLPKKIIGYTSGSNETLSIPFSEYYDEYADYTARRALKKEDGADYEPRFYLMDYNTNKGVVVANLTLGKKDLLQEILDKISVSTLRSFQIIVQTKHKAAKGKNGIELTPEHKDTLEKLKKVSTSYYYDPKIGSYTLDFYVNEVTTKAFEYYFDTSINFYTSIYKLELLNNLIIDKGERIEIRNKRKERKLLAKLPSVSDRDKVLNYSEIKLWLKNGSKVDYLSLSDGEHQFLNVFGTVLMQDEDNSLFLLDEPETHFNPKWRREFVSLWNKICHNRLQDNFITTHSPFVVSDCKREKVYIFKKKDNNSIEVLPPIKETYGSSFDFILQSAFGLDNTLSEMAFDEIKDLLKSENSNEIEGKLENFGESTEKFFLFKRIEDLKTLKDNAS